MDRVPGVLADSQGKAGIVVRPATLEDLNQIVKVDQEVWGEIFPSEKECFESRIRTFPEAGVVVAEVEGVIEAFVSLQLVDDVALSPSTSWDEVTDKGRISRTHNPKGKWLYGVGLAATKRATHNSAVYPLLLHVGKYAIKHGKQGIVLASRIPGYHKFPTMSPQEYVLKKSRCRPIDPELRKYERYDVKVKKPVVLVKDYMGPGSDPESLGWSVLVVWKNPFYRLPFGCLWSKVFRV